MSGPQVTMTRAGVVITAVLREMQLAREALMEEATEGLADVLQGVPCPEPGCEKFRHSRRWAHEYGFVEAMEYLLCST